MEISRNSVRLFVIVTGILVLASYVFGISRISDPQALWGGIPESWRGWNTTTMFAAAAGFLIAWWFFLYKWDAAAVDTVQWPWAKGSVGGHSRLLLAFALITVPSMFWLETTILHIRIGSTLTQILVIGNLWLACTGNILLGLIALGARKQRISSGTFWPLLGAIMLGMQVIINDGILWNIMYPW